MFFKNLQLYRLHDQPDTDASYLEEILGEHHCLPLGGSEARRLGWAIPSEDSNAMFLHELQGHRLLTALRQERILPASVVTDAVEEKVWLIESHQGRMVGRQERANIKEEVYEQLLPRAFVKTERINLWWDINAGLIGVDCSSRKRAEEVLDLLRETLGSLKVTPLATNTLPMRAMTEWLWDPLSRPAGLMLGDTVELKAKGDDGVIRGKHVDLESDEIRKHLDSGRQISKMAMEMEGRLAFVLHDDLSLKALRFDDALLDEANQADDEDDPIIRLETDFLLMAQSLSESIARLTEWLGGEVSHKEAA